MEERLERRTGQRKKEEEECKTEGKNRKRARSNRRRAEDQRRAWIETIPCTDIQERYLDH